MYAGPTSSTQRNPGRSSFSRVEHQGEQKSSDGSSQWEIPADRCDSAGEPASTVLWSQFPVCLTCAAWGFVPDLLAALGSADSQIFARGKRRSCPAGLSWSQAVLGNKNHPQRSRHQASRLKVQPAAGMWSSPRSAGAPPDGRWERLQLGGYHTWCSPCRILQKSPLG